MFHTYTPFIFLFSVILLTILNFFAFIGLLPSLITLPLLFLSIYLTLYNLLIKPSSMRQEAKGFFQRRS